MEKDDDLFDDVDDLDEDDLEDEEGEKGENEESSKNNENETSKEPENTKKRQSREDNHKYAELRRRNEELTKKNKDLETKVVEADFNARSKIISKDTLEELGLSKIEDDYDLVLCEAYEEAVKNGSDNPLLDANKAYRSKINAERAKAKKEEDEKAKASKLDEENKQKVEADKVEFKKKFGITTAEALKNEEFMGLYKQFISYGNLTELYSNYLNVVGKDKDEEAKKMGVIPLSSSRTQSPKKSINDLSGADFLKAFNEKYN